MGMSCGNTMLVPTYHMVILRSGGLAALHAYYEKVPPGPCIQQADVQKVQVLLDS